MEKNIPKAWGKGPINLGGVELDCYILEDGTPILNKGRMMKALGRTWILLASIIKLKIYETYY